jgi:hypothetical protein
MQKSQSVFFSGWKVYNPATGSGPHGDHIHHFSAKISKECRRRIGILCVFLLYFD